MTKTKKRQKNEQYEDYWRITLGNTNYFETNSQAMKVLKLLSDYVDKKEPTLIGNNKGRYRNLQDEVLKVSPKPAKSLESQRESARKEINQFTKLGFFKNGLTEKTLFVDEFINSRSIRKRQK